ncbi:MAG: methionine adenosyltransferase [Alphaproteobacteria bacterium]|jgi:S-adenosylmethionine synthetase|nr:methionine adenosyltransferase [Candidatus Jidaibacter sp.]
MKFITQHQNSSRTDHEYLFTSESVSPGHPDKVCDQISDAILDLFLSHDPSAKVAAETMVVPNNVIVGGEITSTYYASQEEIGSLVRNIIKDIGYKTEPFNYESVKINNFISEQSPEIFQAVSQEDHNQGAGDQGIMFGYACRETPVLMPAAIYYSHRIINNVFDAIQDGSLQGLGPDAKTQVTLNYSKAQPYSAESIVLSIQHSDSYSQDDVRRLVLPYIEKSMPEGWMCGSDKLLINPSGRFTIGGPAADTGLTGRKIIVDTYGGAVPHGGGAFSGKDPSKVDRSAAYACRYLAKNIVASGLAEKCLIQISYAIGVAQPLSVYLTTYKTATVPEAQIIRAVSKSMDLTPYGIRKHLKLDRPIYRVTANYGHFGRDARENGEFSWEKTDLIDELLHHVKL